MKYFAGISILILGLFLGAHSQTGGQSCVTSIEVNGKEYFGRVKLVTPMGDARLPMVDVHASPNDDGSTTIYLGIYPPAIK